MKKIIHLFFVLLAISITFAQETDQAFLSQKAVYNKKEKEKKLAYERVKNSGTYDLEGQFSQSRLMLHQDLYAQFITICKNEISFIESNTVLIQNLEFQSKLIVLKSELDYHQKASIKTTFFEPYKNPNQVADVNPYKVDDGFRYEQIFEKIKEEKTDLSFFITDFKKRILQCSTKICWNCKGVGTVKEKTGTETVRSTNDVWTAQSKTVNTSTGHVNTSYGFNKVTTSKQVDKYSDVDCIKCAGTGKCASSSCIEYTKYQVAINKYFPSLCVE